MIVALLAVANLLPDLKLDLKSGDQWTSRLEQSFLPLDSTNTAEDEEKYTYQYRISVIEPGSQSFGLQSRSRLIAHRFGGENLPGTNEAPDLVESYLLERTGKRPFTPERYSDPIEFRLSRIVWFGYPTSGSDQWITEWPVIGDYWAPAATATYRRIGATERLGRKCSLFSVDYSEKGVNPIAAKGRVEVDEQTGIVMAANLKSERAPLPGGTEPHTLAVKLEVTELKLKKR